MIEGDITQDLCSIQDALLEPLLHRLQEAGVEDEQLTDVGRTFVETQFRMVRVIGAATGISIIEEDV